MRKILVFLIFCSLYQITNAQSKRIKFEHISLEQGLSQSSVTSIIQDSRGFMWFTTIDGLNKYDGYKIHIYYSFSDIEGSLPDNVLNTLFETNDELGNYLWVGTAGSGICKYNKLKNNFQKFCNNPKDTNSLINDAVTAINGDNKNLWIGTEGGLSKLDLVANKWKSFTTNNSTLKSNQIICLTINNNILWIGTQNGLYKIDLKTEILEAEELNLPNNYINNLYFDKQNKLWICTENGLCNYDLNLKQLKTYQNNPKDKNSINDNHVTSIIEDQDNILWIGTREGGLNRFDITNNKFFTYRHDPSDINSLSINHILTIYQDKANILWIGTSLGGINKWNRAADDLALFRHNPYDDFSLSSSQVRSIYESKNGTIWIGTVDGGLNKWNTKENKFIHYKHTPSDPNSLSHNHVRSIFEDSQGNFWIGTGGGGINLFDTLKHKFFHYKHNPDDSKSLSNNIVWKIIEDKKQRLWIATNGGGLNYFDKKNKSFKAFTKNQNNSESIVSNNLTFLLLSKDGKIWIGSFGGVSIFDPDNESFKNFTNDPNQPSSLSNNRVYAILQDSKDRIWVATKGGLNQYIPETSNFKRYTTRSHDFPNNVIMGLLEDNNGNLWLTTNRGITKFNPETEKTRNYDIRDGLQSNEFLAGSCLKTKSGEMIFGGINGFNAFFAEKIRDNQNKPSLVITGFLVSNSELELDTTISEKNLINLKHWQTDISFNYVALDYIFPEKNQYAYQLVGYDDTWNYVKFERTAKYTNLPPKKYIFKVKGSNNDEVWNEIGTSIVVNIQPAFWQTRWFKIAIPLLILFLAFVIVRVRIKLLQRQKEHLEEQVRLRTEEVVKQKEEIQKKNIILEQQKEEIEATNENLKEANELLLDKNVEIEAQKDKIQKQHEVVSHQKKEITDSIHYAKKIQTAALPQTDFLDEILPNYFILFKPRDIVSGDFFWAAKVGNKVIATAADCTGHGVPGAFMSMLGISFLNEIVNKEGITRPDLILNNLRTQIIKALHQKGVVNEAKDGMDITLVTIDFDRNVLQVAAANNALYYYRNSETEIVKADNMPIAIYDLMQPFKLTEINYSIGDIFYMFSDGYADQFGGTAGKKFMYKKFRELLGSISQQPMEDQKRILNDTIEAWKNHPSPYGKDKFDQIDDIVIFGIKL